jgi:hypothetical protein
MPFDGALGVFLLLLEFSPELIPGATKDTEDSHCLVLVVFRRTFQFLV